MTTGRRWLPATLLAALAYIVAGTLVFALVRHAPEHVGLIRKGLLLLCFIPFALHLAWEHNTLGNPSVPAAAHAALAAAIGAFFFALSAVINVHLTGSGYLHALLFSLVIWPLATFVPAFLLALAIYAAVRMARRTH